MRDKSRFYFDILILIGIAVAIYYLRSQATGDVFGPAEGAEGIMSLLGLD
jgi:hypothetical protein